MKNTEIENHLKIILEKYNLKSLYTKYLFLAIFYYTLKESFYWLLVLFSSLLQSKSEMLTMFVIILLLVYILTVPLKKYYINIKQEFLNKLRIANYKYFNEKLIGIKKELLVNFDFVEYFNNIDKFNDYFNEYILSEQVKFNIPIGIITLLVIAYLNNFSAMIFLFMVFYYVCTQVHENKIKKESQYTHESIEIENQLRNYIINSKEFVMNNNFNNKYLDYILESFENVNGKLLNCINIADYKVNIFLAIFIVIVIYLRQDKLNPVDFMVFFLAVYDVEFIADKIFEYYRHKMSYSALVEKLNYLNNIETEIQKQININNKINETEIIINKINIDKPKLNNIKKIKIKPSDKILVNGESGSGKTSLLYLLKGVLKCEELEIEPNIELINSQAFLVLSQHKSIFSGQLGDIISNYESNPNIKLIEEAINISKLIHKFKTLNTYIDIDKLSGGERMRLLIARLIYTIKNNNNYNILLFDEIDENLNKDLAIEIAQKLLTIFKDKTILYITHNNDVKKLFKKQINVKNGIIN